jgi:hypothetical protein
MLEKAGFLFKKVLATDNPELTNQYGVKQGNRGGVQVVSNDLFPSSRHCGSHQHGSSTAAGVEQLLAARQALHQVNGYRIL